MRALADFMRRIEDPSTFARERRVLSGRATAWDVSRLEREGWATVPDALSRDDASSLADDVARLVAEGLPAVFVYAYEDVWAIGARLADGASAALGAPYELIADAWAFHVAPGSAGWAAHRGSYELSDRAKPESINVWLALTDVREEDACMHVVPLDRDPGYPHDLKSAEKRASVALPVSRGTALAWNANVLHWGGANAGRTRASITYTLRRGGAALHLEQLDLRSRLDLIADQVLVYGDLDQAITPEIREWAALTSARERMKAALRSRKER